MALFSRRREASQPDDAVQSAADAASAADEQTDAAATVGISVSSFRGLGAQAPAEPAAPAARAEPAAPAEPAASSVAAAPTGNPAVSTTAGSAFGRPGSPTTHDPETVPGLRDNVLLRESLAQLPASPTPQQVMDVARQLLQGHLFLRVQGDARALIAAGSELPLASATIGERRFAVAYSSGRALGDSIRLDGDADTTAMGQPVLAVLRHALASTAEGLIIDPASAPRRVVLPRDLVERMVAAADEELTVKTLLAGERSEETTALLAEALARTTTWGAAGRAGSGEGMGLAEGRSADGSRYLEVYSHPLEVVAMGRGDQPTPITPAQLAAALRSDDGLTGVVLDSRGPWARLTRDHLAPVLALS